MNKNIYGILFSTMLTLSGCNVLQSGLSSAYNLVNCDYKYHSISNLTISDMNLSNGISVLMIPKVLSILSGNTSSIPLNFTLNQNVKNPNSGTAAFQTLNHIISIDDVRFTTGDIQHAFSVDVGETKQLPLVIGIDIAELMRSHSKSAVENILKNFLSLSDTSSKVTIQLKPSFKVGEQIFSSPIYIPVSFSFGGKKAVKCRLCTMKIKYLFSSRSALIFFYS
jgi:LEA14-like dessication related protein